MYVDPMNTEGFGERVRDDLEREPWRERFGELDIWKLQGLVYLARIVKETRSILFSIWSIYQTGFCSSTIIEYLPDWFI